MDPGFDAINDKPGPVDINQETSPFVDQETSPFVDSAGNYVVNQETSPFVDQETSPFVDQETSPFVDRIPPGFGHGTMVAGIVHLVAPNVRIVPIRAFDDNGSGDHGRRHPGHQLGGCQWRRCDQYEFQRSAAIRRNWRPQFRPRSTPT